MAKDQEKKDTPRPPKAAAEPRSASRPKKGHDAAPVEDDGPRVPPRLKVSFETKVREGLKQTHGISNPMQMPRLQKIVININMGRHLEGTKIPPHIRQQVIDTLVTVTGQKPIVIKARKSVSNFKLRAGFESSAMVTMRRDRMWHFLDRLINLATPRIKDFRGLPDKAFDRQGNYSFGMTEQGVFPEINMAQAQFTHGMHVNCVFANSSPQLSRYVLEELGMPFRKPDQK
ncbi:MAG: 50S ribosomal protein L5 [Phycisphaeraceae bacterium]|nr:50S ribosomal protein L5 [Phycisphaerae bacterium]MBX3391379.1 50S ribosomal protein L5 [Phycisphaeraceae bacterium]HRJ49458.1 50S ribosomal protein L5 [Phycisphaerales bacterium]